MSDRLVVKVVNEGQERELPGKELEQVVDDDLTKFQEYYCGELENDSLSPPEAAAIKTYLWWKTHPEGPRG
jgi:hypothetical protein